MVLKKLIFHALAKYPLFHEKIFLGKEGLKSIVIPLQMWYYTCLFDSPRGLCYYIHRGIARRRRLV
jgi:hypothetical protein